MYNVLDTVTGEVVRVEKIDPTVHAHRSGTPFTPADLETLEVVEVEPKKASK